MKHITVLMLIGMISLFIFTPLQSYAQSSSPSGRNTGNQEQILQEILSEVRQLREEVQRLKSNATQTQVAIERMRLQQDRVARLIRELSDIREKISEVQVRQAKLNETIEDTKKQVEASLISPAILEGMKRDLEESKHREEQLTEQESQLLVKLNSEQAKLKTLNEQLDELGFESIDAGDRKKN